MPSLINTDVAKNYRQQIVPFSRFGTRKVAWYKIGHADTKNSDDILDMASMNAMISAIQTQAEIVLVGAPVIRNNYAKFMVAVFENTANDGENLVDAGSGEVGYNSGSKTLQEILRNVTGKSDLTVARWYLYGAPEDGETEPNGFSTDSAFDEYDTKAQFMEGYTQQD